MAERKKQPDFPSLDDSGSGGPTTLQSPDFVEAAKKQEKKSVAEGFEDDRPSDGGVQNMVLQTEILDELRRMNRMLGMISRGPRRYTLAFFSGIVRGLGAAIGATVVFALLIGVLSRVNTIPLIGSYLAKVYEFAAMSSPAIGQIGEKVGPTAAPTGDSAASPTPGTTPVEDAAATATPEPTAPTP